MMGRKSLAPRLFHSLSLQEMVPADHLLRRLNKVVDLSFVRQLCAPFYSHTGQPSVDPVVLLKMMLLGYLYGITSERRLAEECSLHLAFRWYLGYDFGEATPDHSVLSKARARFGKVVFEAFFEQVLQLCLQAGLVSGEKLFADSTLVDANASIQSLAAREEVFPVQHSPAEHLQLVYSDNPPDPSERTPKSTAQSPADQPQAAPTPEDESRSKRGRKPKPPRPRRNDLQVSRTDPDAAVVSRPGMKTKLAYKEHFTVDDLARIITAVEVTSGVEEDSAVVSTLLDRQPLPPQAFCADSHYGVAPVYADLERRRIQAVIPRRSPQTRRPKEGRLPLSDFPYDPERDVYVCPQGKDLRRAAYDRRWNRYHYRPLVSDCKECPIRDQCPSPKSIRTVIRSPHQEAIEQAEAHLQTPEGRQTFQRRKSTAEWVIAEAKDFHGLRRARCRGLDNMKIQALLIASVQNLKRLLSAWEAPCPQEQALAMPDLSRSPLSVPDLTLRTFPNSFPHHSSASIPTIPRRLRTVLNEVWLNRQPILPPTLPASATGSFFL